MIKKNSLRIFIILLLTSAILLQGCMFPSPQPIEPEIIEAGTELEGYFPDVPIPVRPPSPGRFTLRYDPSSTLNPLTNLNRDNLLLGSLLYETLFVLDRNLMPEPVLVYEWETEDYITFDFVLKPDIAMNDGSWLTALDAVYSVRRATQVGRFTNRLRAINSITATGDLSFTIVLNAANSRFINLLDVPVIKSGTSGSRMPPGSGPFEFLSDDAMHMMAFSRHRDYENLPISVIHLRECLDTELTELFDAGELSLLWDDPHDAFEVRLNRLRETHYFETTSMQFIGFNANHIAFRNSEVRRAISFAIDRQHIVENIKRPGLTLASPLALSPAFHLYNPDWEIINLEPLEAAAYLLYNRVGMRDYNEDTFLELPDGNGGFIPFTIDFIVNIENTHKVRAAHNIAETLRRNGLNVTVRELPWERFISALDAGSFDMFYGEVQLGADFDLSPLLLPGPLNFGGTANTHYAPYLRDFLAARTEFEINWAAGRLVETIENNAPFAPILYKRHAIYSPIGAITGADPSQSSVFRNLTDWSINLMMLN